MLRLIKYLFILGVLAAVAAAVPAFAPSVIWSTPELPEGMPAPDAKRGEYVYRASGCASCHTAKGAAAKPLAGGYRLKTDFGTFVTPNITPDRETGIGAWSETDFIRAMTIGVSPDGRHYYPSFPYTSYTRMTLLDIRDLWAYLKTVPAVKATHPDHELGFPYSIRPGLGVWKVFFFSPGRFQADDAKSKDWNRGAYLVTGPGHCGECHTPRNFLGVPDSSRAMAGTPKGPEGGAIPNITPHKTDGIGNWSRDEVVSMLEIGMTPSGDSVGGTMGKVIENGTSKLTATDRTAIAIYLLSLPPVAKAK